MLGVRGHLMTLAKHPHAALLSLDTALPQHRGWVGLMSWHYVSVDGDTFRCERCRKSERIVGPMRGIGGSMRAKRDAVAVWAVSHVHERQFSAGDLDEDERKR